MPSLLGRIGSWLRGKVRPPKIAPRKYGSASTERSVGHRGIAAGSLKPGEQDFSPENVSMWRTLSGNEIERFIYDQELMFVHSSNVAAAQYFFEDRKLMLEFKDGSAYLYSNVGEDEAYQFANAQSKGG